MTNNPGRGVLWPNRYKQSQTDGKPNYNGTLNVGQEVINYLMQYGPNALELELSAWVQKSSDPNQRSFLSVSVQVPWEIRKHAQGTPVPVQTAHRSPTVASGAPVPQTQTVPQEPQYGHQGAPVGHHQSPTQDVGYSGDILDDEIPF